MSTFETLFSNNPAPMAISDEQKFIEVNSAFLEVLGYPRDEVIGNSLFKLGLFSDMEKISANHGRNQCKWPVETDRNSG